MSQGYLVGAGTVPQYPLGAIRESRPAYRQVIGLDERLHQGRMAGVIPEDAADLAARRHIAAIQRRNAYVSTHPNVKITHHSGSRRYWEAIRTDADKAVWRIREQDLDAFVNRLEDGDWKIAQLPEPQPNPQEQGEWWDAARKWEAPWGVGRRPRW